MSEVALIVGAGMGFSAAFARLASRHGMQVVLASRDPQRLGQLCTQIGARGGL